MSIYPANLPIDTKIVDLSNNRLDTLDFSVTSTPDWSSVLKLYLQNNSISTFDETNEPKLFANLRSLWIQSNNLSDIPIHLLEHLKHLDAFRLGDNPWNCDCATVRFQEYIEKNFHGRDIDEIRCAERPQLTRNGVASGSYPVSPQFVGQVIYRIPKSELCPQPVEPIEYLDMLNYTVATLAVLIILKLVYDWRWQKRTGKLPRFFKINI